MRDPVRSSSVAGEEGFALVDAMTGLTILATTIIFAVSAADVSRRASISAVELRAAVPTLDYLALISFADLGVQEGSTHNVSWTVALTRETSQPGGVADICRRTVEVRQGKSRRIQTITTLEPCPMPHG